MPSMDLSSESAPVNNQAFTVRVLQEAKRISCGSVTTPGFLPYPSKRVSKGRKSHAIDLFVSGELLEGGEKEQWESLFEESVEALREEEKKEWASKLDGVACSSDAFFPFPDNVHRARKSGVKYLAAPSGSVMDEECIKEADEQGIVFAHTSLRLFHH
jgi:phosphoribosylaminoimidazolecarboxamide formyltransferase / IMP cyclohydrolase